MSTPTMSWRIALAGAVLAAGLTLAYFRLRPEPAWSLVVVTIDTCRADALSASSLWVPAGPR